MTAVSVRTHLMPTYRRRQVRFVRGRGSTLVDESGREYLDLVGGVAATSVGHCHSEVSAAIVSQACRLVHVSNLYETEPAETLARELGRLTQGMLTFFCNSGAEAVECALKLARRHGGARRRIVAAEGGFHGRTLGALSVTGQPEKREPFEPVVGGVTHVPYGDAAALDAAVTEDVAAVVLEPIQGEAGVCAPPPGYLAAARAICDRTGALLVIDEVQTGIGRTGSWFAFEHAGVVPDVVCLAKGLAGGLPIGACLARPEVARAFRPGDHGSTFGGNPVVCAAATAVLSVIETGGLVARAAVAGERLRDGVGRLLPEAEVRGQGLLVGVELPRPVARELVDVALAKGLLVNDVGERVVRMTPPLVVTDDEIDRGLTLLKEAWDEIEPA